MQLVDTHCHIHESNYPLAPGEVLTRARQGGVGRVICVGTSQQSSCLALAFAAQHSGAFAAIGVHPHDTKDGWKEIFELVSFSGDSETKLAGEIPDNHSVVTSSRSSTTRQGYLQPEPKATSGPDFRPGAKPSLEGGGRRGEQNSEKQPAGPISIESYVKEGKQEKATQKLVAIGEIGLDYFYTHSPRDIQIQALQEQIELALKYNLPIIFHVRDAFDDFWPIFDNFHGIRGALHSFTDTPTNLEQGLKRGLCIGVNGISTFTKDPNQQKMFASIPLARLLLETDAPFLTPIPLRGKINEPAFVRHVAEFQATIRGISVEEIAAATTANAHALFALS